MELLPHGSLTTESGANPVLKRGLFHNRSSALWTRQAVRSLIAQVSGVSMPIRTVGEYLKRWGMTPQKPLKRAYEQDPKRP